MDKGKEGTRHGRLRNLAVVIAMGLLASAARVAAVFAGSGNSQVRENVKLLT